MFCPNKLDNLMEVFSRQNLLFQLILYYLLNNDRFSNNESHRMIELIYGHNQVNKFKKSSQTPNITCQKFLIQIKKKLKSKIVQFIPVSLKSKILNLLFPTDRTKFQIQETLQTPRILIKRNSFLEDDISRNNTCNIIFLYLFVFFNLVFI